MDPSTTQKSSPLRDLLLGFVLPVILGLLILAWFTRGQPHLRVIVLNTPGDAFLIQTPNGRSILIDGGNEPNQLASSLGRALPYWQHSLDLIILTQISQRQLIGQISAIEHYQVQQALLPSNRSRSPALQHWRNLLLEQGSKINYLEPQQAFRIDGVTIQALSAPDRDHGLLLQIDYGTTRAIFAHHNHPDNQQILLAQTPAARTLLVIPWEDDAQEQLLQHIRPQHIILSKGYQADKPSRLTWNQRRIAQNDLYHSSIHGQIEWMSNGQETWVITSQKP